MKSNLPPRDRGRIDAGKLAAWYDFQAPLYHFWRDRYDTPLVRRVADLLGGDSAGLILDAGCGSGLYSVGLGLLKPDWRIEGADLSGNLLRIAGAQAAKRGLENVSFTNADATSLPYGDHQFGAIVAAGLFPNLEDPRRALQEFSRTLRGDGRLVVVEFDRETLDRRTKLFFAVMIFGYHVFTTVFRRYRFAGRWNLETSTIEQRGFEELLRGAGFSIREVLREHQHVIYLCRKA